MENHTPPTEPVDPDPPHSEAPDSVQPNFDLILGDATTSEPRRPPPRRPASPPVPETPVVTTTSLDPLLEHLSREIAAMVATAKEEIREAAASAATSAVSRISGHLDSRARAIDAHAAEATRQTLELNRKVDELLHATAAVAENNDSLTREVQEAMETKLENLVKRVEDLLKALLKHSEDQVKDVSKKAQALLSEAKQHGIRLGWKPWSMATAFALATILATTLLRPGWTMSAEQRRALRVGEAVIYTYSAATDREQAEMRRVMRWRTPEHPDSVEAPQVPRRP